MAVTINDFEVMTEPRAIASPAPTTTPPNEDEHLPTPEELARLLRRELERELRVWAH